MANTNIKKEAYIFKQTSEQIQAILDALEVLGEHNIRELLDLVNDIIAIIEQYVNEIYSSTSTYPKVVSANKSILELALGYIVLPDENVSVGGSELTLTVPQRNFDFVTGTSTTYEGNNKLTTTDKSSVVAAINELVKRVATLEQHRSG